MTKSTFFSDLYHLGESQPIIITDGPPCDYDLPQWIAALTAEEEVGVLWYGVRQPITYEEFKVACPSAIREPGAVYYRTVDIPLVVIPDFGIWVIAPIYRSASDALAQAERNVQHLTQNFGVPRHELGLNIALIPVVDTPIDVSNVDPTMLFSVTDYAHLRAAFIGRRQSYLPAELINISIEHLPNLGEVFDVKEALWDMDPDVPQWLADRTNLVINPNPCRRYKQA